MNIRYQTLTSVMVAAALLFAVSAYGQGGGGRDRRRESYDPAESLKRMDNNNNGLIEPSEVSGRSRSFLERAAERAKLDMTKPMAIDKLLPAMQAGAEEFRKQQEAGRGPGGGPPGGSPAGSPPIRLVIGSTQLPGGFGPPAAGGSPPASTSSGFGTSSSRAGTIMSLETKFEREVIEYVNDKLLREQDKNGDGNIDKTEWTAAGTWSKSNPPENSDVNKDGKLSREELCIRISKARGIPIKGETASSSPGAPPFSNGPPGGSSSGPDFKKYAEGLLRQFDKSKDGMLQRDEWKEMKTEHQGADSNNDGTITLDELSSRIATYPGGGSSPLSSSSSPAGYGSRSYKGNSDKTASATKKSYRFLTPTERLPKGMPDEFLKSDADGDGQIMMHEFSTSWTDATAARFTKFDADGDGIITPNEWLAVEPKK